MSIPLNISYELKYPNKFSQYPHLNNQISFLNNIFNKNMQTDVL